MGCSLHSARHTKDGAAVRRTYLGGGTAVAAALGAFRVVEVFFSVFFDRLRTFDLTTVVLLALSVTVS